MNTQKSGYIAIIGRPNVGKSTLLNGLIGKKISITSRKPQTTRTQILGIKTIGDAQAVYIDTPGLHTHEKNAMNRYMNRLAEAVMADADIVIFMIDSMRWHPEDDGILDKLKSDSVPVILVINKADLLKDKNLLLPFIQTLQDKFHFKNIVPMSARKKSNVLHLEKIIMQLLPEGAHLFPDDQVTDKSERFQAAELIREKIILATGQEIPYSTTVVIEEFKHEGKLLRISALIWVEREGQKPILIGKNGERLKAIGTAARKDLEKCFNTKVFLQLWVKIKDNWTNNENFISHLGFE
jgi:GTP-binding protein Era